MKQDFFRGLQTFDIKEAKIILTGIPFDGNASIGKGASLEPKVMRELSSFFPPLTRDGYLINDFPIFDNGDINLKDGEDCETYFARIQKEMLKVYQQEKFAFIVGGDHSIAIPPERAFLDYAKEKGKEAVIIHIDAHPDICDIYEDSIYSHACPNKRAIDYGYKKENIVLIGIRGFEEQEVIYFRNNPEIKYYTSTYLQENGSEGMLNEIINKYKDDKYIIYLSYDIDANDPCFAPGTGTPEAFGLNNLMILNIINSIVGNLNVKAMDMVEISPQLDNNDITTWLGLKTLYEVIYQLKNKKK